MRDGSEERGKKRRFLLADKKEFCGTAFIRIPRRPSRLFPRSRSSKSVIDHPKAVGICAKRFEGWDRRSGTNRVLAWQTRIGIAWTITAPGTESDPG